jgi:hypothetical protein
MNIVFPSNTTEIINDIRNAVGRLADFYYVYSSQPCPSGACHLDPITNTSTNSWCTICSGNYWIPLYIKFPILAHVTWGGSDMASWQTGGMIFDGDCTLQIAYSGGIEDLVDKTRYVVVDNKTMEIKKMALRGFQGLNRVIITLIEKED